MIAGILEERVDTTPDLAGGLRFGSNTEVPKNLEDFSVSEDIKKQMLPFNKSYLPNVEISRLNLNIYGIRLKIYDENNEVADFNF